MARGNSTAIARAREKQEGAERRSRNNLALAKAAPQRTANAMLLTGTVTSAAIGVLAGKSKDDSFAPLLTALGLGLVGSIGGGIAGSRGAVGSVASGAGNAGLNCFTFEATRMATKFMSGNNADSGE